MGFNLISLKVAFPRLSTSIFTTDSQKPSPSWQRSNRSTPYLAFKDKVYWNVTGYKPAYLTKLWRLYFSCTLISAVYKANL